jgi:hypothetical protein
MVVVLIANVLVMAAVSFQIYRKESNVRGFYWLALMAKLFAGFVLGILYLHYYKEGDTISYFLDTVRVSNLAKDNLSDYFRFLWSSESSTGIFHELHLQQPRAIFFTKVGSVFALMTGSNYWLISAWFSMISFIGSWILVNELIAYKKMLRPAAIFAFLFFPSVVFWTSGFIKESMAMAALYLIVVFFLRLWQRKALAPTWYVIFVISIWLVWNLKYYYLAVLLPILTAEWIYRRFVSHRVQKYPTAVRILTWSGLLIVPLIAVSTLHPNFHPSIFLDVVVGSHDLLVKLSSPDDIIQYDDLRPDITSLLRNAPAAFFSGMFRPFLWEAQGPAQWIAALENFFLFLLFAAMVYSMIRRRKPLNDRDGWLLFAYSLLLCVFLAISAPNFGTISRFRVGFLPFFVMLVFHRNNLFDGVIIKISQLRSHLVR